VDRSAYTANYIADITKPELLLPENAPATFAWLTRDIAPSGVMGNPRPATAENGTLWLDQAATRLAAALEAMAHYPNPDKPYPKKP
jgi:creatinine amidohydrolase